jgi:hypothetical protein
VLPDAAGTHATPHPNARSLALRPMFSNIQLLLLRR